RRARHQHAARVVFSRTTTRRRSRRSNRRQWMGAGTMATAGRSAGPRLTPILAIRGALAIVLGLATAGLFVLAVMFPRVTADVLVLLFGVYVLLDGLTALIGTSRSSASYAWWLRLQ